MLLDNRVRSSDLMVLVAIKAENDYSMCQYSTLNIVMVAPRHIFRRGELNRGSQVPWNILQLFYKATTFGLSRKVSH
jgi:hypothetical protein